MDRITINRCLNKEMQFYGLKFTGILSGFLIGILVLLKFDFTFAIIGGVGGYLLGAELSGSWHKGDIHRWCYWHLPTQLFFASKYLPKSCDRKLL